MSVLDAAAKAEAKKLLDIRPPVLEGTRVIFDGKPRRAWYAHVCERMNALELVTPAQINEFCDLAGVPD